MLRLPIFQKNKMNPAGQSDNSCSPRASVPAHTVPSSAISQVSQSSKCVNVNKKKAEFEKKIRKFIESDSPHKPIQSRKAPSEYSF
jgi:hypothetical protein